MSEDQLEEKEVDEAPVELPPVEGVSEGFPPPVNVNYGDWWMALKVFAMKHRETPTATPKTVGEMLLEFIAKVEAGDPV